MAKPVIVLVDDDPHHVELLQTYLEAKGCEVHTGFDGYAALKLSREHRPDVLILDVDMPGMGGTEVLENLRGDKDMEMIPVIMLTGVVSADIYPVIESMPRVSHIKKPVELEDLYSMVEHYLPKT